MTKVRKEPTLVQEKIFEFIRRSVRQRGVPPSIKEIGKAVGLSSSSSVHHQLHNLENLGLIRRDRTKSRCISILEGEHDKKNDAIPEPLPHQESRGNETPAGPESPPAPEAPEAPQSGIPPPGTENAGPGRSIKEYAVVILGSDQDSGSDAPLSIKSIPLPVQFVGSTDAFLLEMQGDGMREAAILDGDLCIIKHQAHYDDGDMVAVKIDEEVSIKKVFRRTGYYILESENHRYKPMIAREPTFLGKVIGILRNVERKRSWLSQEM
jgi:repressor LexA